MARVLFVDDEAPIRRAVAAWLTRKGHEVHEAGSLAEARTVLDSVAASLDGVFIDLRLAEESGLELYRWMQAHHPDLAGRVAFVTGDLFDGPALERQHASPVFNKPFELRDIEAQVAAWDGGRG